MSVSFAVVVWENQREKSLIAVEKEKFDLLVQISNYNFSLRNPGSGFMDLQVFLRVKAHLFRADPL